MHIDCNDYGDDDNNNYNKFTTKRHFPMINVFCLCDSSRRIAHQHFIMFGLNAPVMRTIQPNH